MAAIGITFEHWGAGIAAAVLVALTVAVAMRRGIAVPRATLVLAGVGAALIALAAGGLAAARPAPRSVVVMVDLSPSTRGAAYRERTALERRVAELLGDTPREFVFFAEQIGVPAGAEAGTLPDLPASRTVLPATNAPAVVLFSDGRFTVGTGAAPPPPVYAVIDSKLEAAADAAVTALDARGEDVVVGVRNTSSAPRRLALQGVEGDDAVSIAPGSFALSRKRATGANAISAVFAPGDAWPENDALRTAAPPPAAAERWWVGGTAPDASWKPLDPRALPTDASPYLGSSAIVLDNVLADSLTPALQASLNRYVRELGGGLIVLGGDRAFAAGGYAGTALDALSPLASTPPEPTTHWLLLADASGSMNQDASGGRTRWQFAADAIVSAARQLPPADVLSIGAFARDVRWWSDGRPVSETMTRPLPPADVRPGGPTNLEAALRHIAESANDKLPKQLLIATDAQATIADVVALGERLKTGNVRLHVLLIGDPSRAEGLAALQSIVAATGGTLREESDPANWTRRLQEAVRAAQPHGVRRDAVTVRFIGPLESLPPVAVSQWNPTWPRPGTTPLAEADVANAGTTMAAQWNVGVGRVAAVAFAPPAAVANAAAKLVERPPRDPRFSVTWEVGSIVRVVVDAGDDTSYLNGERLTLEMSESDGRWRNHTLRQAGPGRYEIRIDAPRRATLARVRHDARILDTVPLPARYPPEFDAVGNDRVALAALAKRTGGAVIEPGVTRRLDLPRPRRVVSGVSFLATVGAAFVLAGLVRWRVGS